VSGPKRENVTGDWRKLQNKKFITCRLLFTKLYLSDKMKKYGTGEACGMYE
jgi:hypothetical protein